MNKRKSLLTKLAETLDQERTLTPELPAQEQRSSNLSRLVRWFLPNGGTVVIVLLLIASQSIWGQFANCPYKGGSRMLAATH